MRYGLAGAGLVTLVVVIILIVALRPAPVVNVDRPTRAPEIARDTDPGTFAPRRPSGFTSSDRKAIPRPRRPSATASDGVVLPPPNAPLVDVYPALKRLADAGDARAACRLAYELDRCGNLPILKVIAKNYAGRLAKAKQAGNVDPRQAHLAEYQQRSYENAAKACNGFPREDTKDAWRYSLLAAQSGNGAAIMNFIGMKIGLDQRNPGNTADGWSAYHDLGPSLMQRALDQGMPDAYQYAASIYAWKDAPDPLVPYDPVRALAIYKGLSAVADDQYKTELSGKIDFLLKQYHYSQSDLAQADAEAASISSVIAEKAAGPIDGEPSLDRGQYCERY